MENIVNNVPDNVTTLLDIKPSTLTDKYHTDI